MKKIIRLCILAVAGCFTSLYYVQAQNQAIKTEVLVFILPDSLEIPESEKGQITLDRTVIKSEEVRKVFSALEIKSISKAFPDWDEKDNIGTNKDGVRVQKPNFHRVFSLQFENEKQADAAIERLTKLPAVLYAEKNSDARLDNDPHYLSGMQWNLRNTGANGGVAGVDVNAEEAWSIYTGNLNNAIAIFDTGVDLNHEEFQNRITGDAPVGGAHGTMVAGVAAAKGNNGVGIRGLDWNAMILSKRIFDSNGDYIGDSQTAQKITQAVSFGAEVMNHSWSGPNWSTTLRAAFAYAYKMNMVAVATMGNTAQTETRYPGAFDDVITVGAITNWNGVSWFSTRGNHIDVAAPGGQNDANNLAPGVDIFTTMPGNNYGLTSGTSFAAPAVSGLASLLKGYKTSLANDDIANIIRLSAADIDDPGFDPRTGFGRIDAGRALRFLQQPFTLNQWTASGGTVENSTGGYNMLFMDADGYSGTLIVKRYEVRKTITFPQPFCHIEGVWGRGVGTTGWSQANPNYGVGFTEVVPGTLTATGVTLRTYVYERFNTLGQNLGYAPATPQNVVFAYTVLGIPATPALPTISANPASINLGASSQLTASGCAGTLVWSTGQTGNSITVSPTQTTAYTATCSQFNCPTSISAPVSVTVIPPTPINLTLSIWRAGDSQTRTKIQDLSNGDNIPISALNGGEANWFIDIAGGQISSSPGNGNYNHVSLYLNGNGYSNQGWGPENVTNAGLPPYGLHGRDWGSYPPVGNNYQLTGKVFFNSTELASKTVTFNIVSCTPPSAPSISITQGTTACASTPNNSVTLTATGCGGTVTWFRNGNQVATGSTTHTTNIPGAYTATCTSGGCTSGVSGTVNVAQTSGCGGFSGRLLYAVV